MCTGAHAFIPVENGIKIIVAYLCDGQHVQNTFWVQKDTAVTADDVDSAVSITELWVHTNMPPNTSDKVTLLYVDGQDHTTADGYHKVGTTYAGEQGEKATDMLPSNVTWAIKLNTAAAGRSGHGRIYRIGLTEDQVTGNLLHNDAAANFVSDWQALQANLALDGLNLAVVSYCHAGAWRTSAFVNQVTSIGYTDLIIDSQRRRLPGRGR